MMDPSLSHSETRPSSESFVMWGREYRQSCCIAEGSYIWAIKWESAQRRSAAFFILTLFFTIVRPSALFQIVFRDSLTLWVLFNELTFVELLHPKLGARGWVPKAGLPSEIVFRVNVSFALEGDLNCSHLLQIAAVVILQVIYLSCLIVAQPLL